MKAVRIDGFTRIMGVDQSYQALPIRDETIDLGPPYGEVPCMVSEWSLSDDEREALAAGAPLRLTILGISWPPVKLEVAAQPRRP